MYSGFLNSDEQKEQLKQTRAPEKGKGQTKWLPFSRLHINQDTVNFSISDKQEQKLSFGSNWKPKILRKKNDNCSHAKIQQPIRENENSSGSWCKNNKAVQLNQNLATSEKCLAHVIKISFGTLGHICPFSSILCFWSLFLGSLLVMMFWFCAQFCHFDQLLNSEFWKIGQIHYTFALINSDHLKIFTMRQFTNAPDCSGCQKSMGKTMQSTKMFGISQFVQCQDFKRCESLVGRVWNELA